MPLPSTRTEPARVDRPTPASTRHTHVTPLIEASETYPALESGILDAEHEVLMAYWTFEPNLGLHGGRAPQGVETWKDMLLHKVRQRVTVRILIGDFDPVFAYRFHGMSGSSYLDLMGMRDELDEADRAHFQIATSLNQARGGRLFERLVQPLRRSMLRDLCKEGRQVQAEQGREAMLHWLRRLPRAWPEIELKDDGPHPRKTGFQPIYPAAHHEKTCMIDRQVAFVGGLDIESKRFDTPRHEAENAWHDLVVRIEGAPVGRLGNRLAKRWNEEREAFHGMIADQRRPLGRPPDGIDPWPECSTTPLDELKIEEDTPTQGDPYARLVSTASRRTDVWFHRTPQPVDTGVREALYRVIDGAERLLYVETQFLRDTETAWRIAERAEAEPHLRVVLLLPLLPETMSEQRWPNAATRHGHWLQWKCVSILRTRLADRLGVYTLIRNAPSKEGVQPQATAYGSDLIYCHAKLVTADDRHALVGSANLNGRSLAMDTEACLEWRDAEGVAPFRKRLWRQHFGGGLAGGPEHPELEDDELHAAALAWDRLALENRDLEPGWRHGYVVPFPEDHLGFQGSMSLLVPDNGV
jgi:phosphatidylserine/phosphatidylglycerophosphate/cardiolipin synthase-like enzyme